MIPVKLVTLKGEYDGQLYGECDGDELIDKKTIRILFNTIEPISFEYGVILPSNSTVPIPVLAYSASEKGSVTCYPFINTDRTVYRPFVNDGFYQYRIPQPYLDMFVKYGAATEKVIDKVMTCPECDSISFTIRPGCPGCGSYNTRPDQLVHHYACGNVDLLETFTINRQMGTLACSKCHKEGLIINVDYDVSAGLHRCMECGWTGSNIKLIGKCFCCDTLFLITEAKEISLKEYEIL